MDVNVSRNKNETDEEERLAEDEFQDSILDEDFESTWDNDVWSALQCESFVNGFKQVTENASKNLAENLKDDLGHDFIIDDVCNEIFEESDDEIDEQLSSLDFSDSERYEDFCENTDNSQFSSDENDGHIPQFNEDISDRESPCRVVINEQQCNRLEEVIRKFTKEQDVSGDTDWKGIENIIKNIKCGKYGTRTCSSDVDDGELKDIDWRNSNKVRKTSTDDVADIFGICDSSNSESTFPDDFLSRDTDWRTGSQVQEIVYVHDINTPSTSKGTYSHDEPGICQESTSSGNQGSVYKEKNVFAAIRDPRLAKSGRNVSERDCKSNSKLVTEVCENEKASQDRVGGNDSDIEQYSAKQDGSFNADAFTKDSIITGKNVEKNRAQNEKDSNGSEDQSVETLKEGLKECKLDSDLEKKLKGDPKDCSANESCVTKEKQKEIKENSPVPKSHDLAPTTRVVEPLDCDTIDLTCDNNENEHDTQPDKLEGKKTENKLMPLQISSLVDNIEIKYKGDQKLDDDIEVLSESYPSPTSLSQAHVKNSVKIHSARAKKISKTKNNCSDVKHSKTVKDVEGGNLEENGTHIKKNQKTAKSKLTTFDMFESVNSDLYPKSNEHLKISNRRRSSTHVDTCLTINEPKENNKSCISRIHKFETDAKKDSGVAEEIPKTSNQDAVKDNKMKVQNDLLQNLERSESNSPVELLKAAKNSKLIPKNGANHEDLNTEKGTIDPITCPELREEVDSIKSMKIISENVKTLSVLKGKVEESLKMRQASKKVIENLLGRNMESPSSNENPNDSNEQVIKNVSKSSNINENPNFKKEELPTSEEIQSQSKGSTNDAKKEPKHEQNNIPITNHNALSKVGGNDMSEPKEDGNFNDKNYDSKKEQENFGSNLLNIPLNPMLNILDLESDGNTSDETAFGKLDMIKEKRKHKKRKKDSETEKMLKKRKKLLKLLAKYTVEEGEILPSIGDLKRMQEKKKKKIESDEKLVPIEEIFKSKVGESKKKNKEEAIFSSEENKKGCRTKKEKNILEAIGSKKQIISPNEIDKGSSKTKEKVKSEETLKRDLITLTSSKPFAESKTEVDANFTNTEQKEHRKYEVFFDISSPTTSSDVVKDEVDLSDKRTNMRSPEKKEKLTNKDHISPKATLDGSRLIDENNIKKGKLTLVWKTPPSVAYNKHSNILESDESLLKRRLSSSSESDDFAQRNITTVEDIKKREDDVSESSNTSSSTRGEGLKKNRKFVDYDSTVAVSGQNRTSETVKLKQKVESNFDSKDLVAEDSLLNKFMDEDWSPSPHSRGFRKGPVSRYHPDMKRRSRSPSPQSRPPRFRRSRSKSPKFRKRRSRSPVFYPRERRKEEQWQAKFRWRSPTRRRKTSPSKGRSNSKASWSRSPSGSPPPKVASPKWKSPVKKKTSPSRKRSRSRESSWSAHSPRPSPSQPGPSSPIRLPPPDSPPPPLPSLQPPPPPVQIPTYNNSPTPFAYHQPHPPPFVYSGMNFGHMPHNPPQSQFMYNAHYNAPYPHMNPHQQYYHN